MPQPMLENAAHLGMVTTLGSLMSRILALGLPSCICGSSGLRIKPTGGADELRLLRTVRCDGMKGDGCKGAREREMLRVYIARCVQRT